MPTVVVKVVGQLFSDLNNPVTQRPSRYVDDRLVRSHSRCGLQVFHALAKRLRYRCVPSAGLAVGNSQLPLPLVVEALEVSRLDVPHFVAAETVKCEAKGDASTGVFVLDEREQLLLFRPREPQSLS
ncbi:hypothetical protein [Haloferax sp. Atlit-47N]|uniref:hypothetical protein n=1 Tax=Haloferax sp. Atlit-47N TaxID=2077199 RepID=UPI0018F5B367|nr:hypothetical protein [Haloferax sp. Atlit-47N]